MKILITGFDPFGGESINPSFEAVKRLPDHILGSQIIKLEIPTVAYKSFDRCIEAIKANQPDVVLNIGQAGGRFAITPEKVAINLNDFRIPDNEGNQFMDSAIFNDGENAYFTTLPVKSMAANIMAAGIPSSVSYSAGTFICNHIMYAIAYYIHQNSLNIKSGFIHIPFMNEQVVSKPNMPAMSLETLTIGLQKAVEAIITSDITSENTFDKKNIPFDIGGTIC